MSFEPAGAQLTQNDGIFSKHSRIQAVFLVLQTRQMVPVLSFFVAAKKRGSRAAGRILPAWVPAFADTTMKGADTKRQNRTTGPVGPWSRRELRPVVR